MKLIPQISIFNISLIWFIIIWGSLIYMFYPTQARITAKWTEKIHTLSSAIEVKRAERAKAKEEYLKLDSTLSGAISTLKESVSVYQDCLDHVSYDCNIGGFPQASASDITSNWTDTPAISGVPWWLEDKNLSLECEIWTRKGKVEWIEFHYTATKDTTLKSIKSSHSNNYWIDHIWYHYVIKSDWEITSTRDEKCISAADKWNSNNYRYIQVAFIWDDKPTKAQTVSMIKLTKMLQIKYNLSKTAVTSHNEEWPKSPKENLNHWYWSKDNFLKMIRQSYSVSLYGKQKAELTYAWEAWWDIDFILTLQQESWMSNSSIWDQWNSIGYCQIHKGYQPGWHAEYSKLKTWQERMNYCHEKYVYASTLKWWVWSRFHGYNLRTKHLPSLKIN